MEAIYLLIVYRGRRTRRWCGVVVGGMTAGLQVVLLLLQVTIVARAATTTWTTGGETNSVSRVWPRAAAVSENLWALSDGTNPLLPQFAATRRAQWRCRMQAEPVQGGALSPDWDGGRSGPTGPRDVCALGVVSWRDANPLKRPIKADDELPCDRCASDWKQVQFEGVGPHNQSRLCSLVQTCADDVADCDFTQPPDDVFPTCKNLKLNATAPKPTLRQFTGSRTGQNTSTLMIRQTSGGPGPFVLFIAPRFSYDYYNWACYYMFSYLATQGIATFTATIPDIADSSRDNWNHVPSAGRRPYEYSCAQLDTEGPGCDNSSFGNISHFLHDLHLEDVISYAESVGYNSSAAVWWGYSEGGAMVSEHLNYFLQYSSSTAHIPRAMVLESNGGSYCYAFRPWQEAELKSTAYWSSCTSWSDSNCCPELLTEQYYWQRPGEYLSHPPVLLVGGDSDLSADPNGIRFYHDTMRHYSARSAKATWSGTQHGISPLAFGFAASFIKDALLD